MGWLKNRREAAAKHRADSEALIQEYVTVSLLLASGPSLSERANLSVRKLAALRAMTTSEYERAVVQATYAIRMAVRDEVLDSLSGDR